MADAATLSVEPIEFVDLGAQRRRIGARMDEAIRAGPRSRPVHSWARGRRARSAARGILRRQARHCAAPTAPTRWGWR